MTLPARLLALALSLLPLSASAEEAVARWGDAEIPYDAAVWRIVSPKEAADGITLACIAADCPEGAQVYALIELPNGSAAEEPWRGPKAIELQAPALPFLAYQLWSGCRALDAPILSAAVVFRGRLYRLVTAAGGGCNFGPQVPLARFTDLVEGVRPRDVRSLAIGGIRLAYDAGRWTPSAENPGAGAEGLLFTCTLRECHGWRGEQAYLRVSMRPAPDASCLPERGDGGEGNVRDQGNRDFGGLKLNLWTTFSGCRASTPPQRNACGRHGDLVYRFASGAHSGCSAGIEAVPEQLFEEFLSGISLAEGMPASP